MSRYVYRKNYVISKILQEYEISQTLINVKENTYDNDKIKIKIDTEINKTDLHQGCFLLMNIIQHVGI